LTSVSQLPECDSLAVAEENLLAGGAKAGSRGRVLILVTVLTAVVTAMGYVRDAVFASKLGASAGMDAYLAAFFVPNTLYLILIAGTMSPVFITVFSEHESRGREQALTVFRIVSTFAAVVLALLVGLGIVTGKLWLPLLFSGFAPAQLQLSLRILYFVFPAIIFLGLAGMVSPLLNSLGHFAAPAISPAMYSLATIPVLLVAPRDRLIEWVAIATAIGLAAQLLVQLPAAAALGVHWRPDFRFRHPAMRQLLRIALPLLAYLVVANASLLIERNIASRLFTGAISTLNYATRLFSIPVNLLIMPLAVVFYPSFAKEAAREGRGNLVQELKDALRITIFLALPITCWLVIHALPLTRFIFERGHFGFSNSVGTADMLKVYSLGLLPNALAVMSLRFFYALQDTVTPLLVEIGNLAWYACAAPFLANRYGLLGLGAARAVSFLLVAVVLMLVMRGKLTKLSLTLSSFRFVLKTAFGSLVMCLVTWGTSVLLNPVFQEHGLLGRGFVVISLGAIGAVVYFGICYFFGLREVRSVLGLSSSWITSVWKSSAFRENSA
jgi:putative peptidoglycan lipid II flippase